MESPTKVKLGFFLAFILLLVILLLAFAPKRCGADEECFNAYAARCERAKVTLINLDNQYAYEVRAKKGEQCIVKVVLVQINPNAGDNLKNRLNGQGMLCEIPRELLAATPLAKIENINDYCTGPLKEALLDISLENLYEIVVKQIGPLAVQFKQSLEVLNTTA